MKAAVMEEIGAPLRVHSDWKEPECGPNDAVVRVEANGICRSDYHLWQGGWPWIGLVLTPPVVLGHELSGVIEETGVNVTRVKKGDRVVVPFNHGCGVCPTCQSGHQNVCDSMQAPLGGFARYAKVAVANVNAVPLPEDISFVDAASMGCRFMTAWHGVVDQAGVEAGEWVAVFGCGGVGLAAVNIANAMGANVVAVTRSQEKLDIAKQLGALATVKADDENAVDQIIEITGGGAHVGVDALGTSETCLPAISCLRTRGRHLRLGMSSKADGGSIALPVDLMVARELQFIGSFGMQAARYPEMLRMVVSGKLSPGMLVTKTVSVDQVSDVLEAMKGYQTVGVSVMADW